MTTFDPDQQVSTTEAARLIGVAPKTLGNWRTRRQGPPFYRVSSRAVSYKVADLTAFMEARRQTAEG